MQFDLNEIVERFLKNGKGEIIPVKTGLINNTWKVMPNGSSQHYILQQINRYVFNQPSDLQHNYHLIHTELKNTYSRFALPSIVNTLDNRDVLNLHGEYFRLFTFLENSLTIDKVSSPEQAYTVANSFAIFTKDLININTSRLKVVLPQFHNLNFRLQQLQAAIKENPAKRLKDTQVLLDIINRFEPLIRFYDSVLKNITSFKKYVLHHDAKISNIIFDATTGDVKTPIDLDTTMPGYFFSDMGDMVRSVVPNMHEDHPSYSDLAIQPMMYEAIREGYLEQMKNVFTPPELQHIDYAGLLLALMQGVRFLTDYLMGDIYYKVDHNEHNFQRAANQFELLVRLEQFLIIKYQIKACSK